jgi:hypothetical protein
VLEVAGSRVAVTRRTGVATRARRLVKRILVDCSVDCRTVELSLRFLVDERYRIDRLPMVGYLYVGHSLVYIPSISYYLVPIYMTPGRIP